MKKVFVIYNTTRMWYMCTSETKGVVDHKAVSLSDATQYADIADAEAYLSVVITNSNHNDIYDIQPYYVKVR